MGLLSFALKVNYKRYWNKLEDLSKKVGKKPLPMFIDTAMSTLVCGSGLQDYLNYKFYEKSWKERKEYATIGYQAKFYKLTANIEYAPFFSNKINFHKNFKKYVKRECVSYEDGFDKVKEFIEKRKAVVVKPISGLGGKEVRKVDTKDIKDLKKFYEDLNANNEFVEDLVIQNKEWDKLNPGSINTLRVVTYALNGKSKVMFAVARIGSSDKIVDNFHCGGVGVRIDIDKGCLTGKAINKDNEEFDETPRTKVKVDGYKIPMWDEVKKMVCEAALVNDKVNVVGWDVALSDKGPLLIEGNRGPGMDIIQVLYNRGVKKELEEIKKEVKRSRSK